MKLWTQWLQAVYALRPACRRARTFVWTVLVLVGLCCRADNAGVTSFVRVLNFSGQAYHRFLHLFHSTSLDLDVLTSCWVRLCLVLFTHSRSTRAWSVWPMASRLPRKGGACPA